MSNQTDIHIRLKEIRIQKGYTQIEIADKLNVSRQAVSRWETGKSCPDIDNLTLLGEIYKVSVDELLGKEKIERGEEKKEARFNWEIVCLIAVLGVGIIHPVFGVVMIFCVCVWMIKERKCYKIVIVAIIMSLLINCYNLYVIWSIKNVSNSQTVIEKIK